MTRTRLQTRLQPRPQPASAADPAAEPTPADGPSRRRVLQGCAVACAGGTVLAACATSEPTGSEGGSGEPRPPVAQGGVVSQGLAPGSAQPFEADGRPAVLVRLADGRYVGLSAVCTHQGCAVSYQPDDSQLHCPCHGSVFDPARDGAVVEGPARAPLAGVAVRTEGEQVLLA